MSWEKKKPIHGTIMGCAHNPIYDVAPMDMPIAVGFGRAEVTKDSTVVYKEPPEYDESGWWTVKNAESAAQKDPDHDWRIMLYAPLYGKCYQRQGEGLWVLIAENEGFA